jgi:predicted sugar kinase
MKLFQVYEADLQKLEHALPRLQEFCGTAANRPDVYVLLEEIKGIVSNVRWDYGPHTDVSKIGPLL